MNQHKSVTNINATPTGEQEPTARERVVALAGNPNSGKTTLFNGLTGLRYKVANYPGVTVEKREGSVKIDPVGDVTFLDMPGIYSLSGHSADEKIASNLIVQRDSTTPRPDVIVAVLDATNLERNLYLLAQILDSGIPIVVALNMWDLAESQGIQIHRELLAQALDVPVVTVVAAKQIGLSALKAEIGKLLVRPRESSKRFAWLPIQSPYRLSAALVGSEIVTGSSKDKSSDEGDQIFLGVAALSETLPDVTPSVTKTITSETNELSAKGIDALTFDATMRYGWINSIVRRCVVLPAHTRRTITEQLDKVLTDRVWGTLIFALIMGFIFQSIFLWAQYPMDLIDGLFVKLGDFVGPHLPEGQIRSLIVDGVIAGVGSVVIFVPQIAILFFFLGLLEDTGYLTRAAYLMDRILRPFGLQGRSFIPLLSSFACAIPGILATRTIPSWADRLTTILVAPLMSCSARLPVYTVLIAAFVPPHTYWGIVSLQGTVLLSMYILGIAGACLTAWLLKLTVLRGKPALFVMEMPPFRRPSARTIFRQVYDSVTSFLKNAATVILACAVILWFLASYPRPENSSQTGHVRESYAGQLGHLIEPVIRPLGYNWELGVAIIASFAAREVFVTSLSTVYNLDDNSDESRSLIQTLQKKREDGTFTTLTAISLMVFYVFACQCMSTLAVCRRETGSWGWTAFMFSYMTLLAYLTAFLTFQIGTALGF